MKCYSTEESEITFFNTEDGTPLLIIDSDSFEITDEGIKFDEEVGKIVIQVMGIQN